MPTLKCHKNKKQEINIYKKDYNYYQSLMTIFFSGKIDSKALLIDDVTKRTNESILSHMLENGHVKKFEFQSIRRNGKDNPLRKIKVYCYAITREGLMWLAEYSDCAWVKYLYLVNDILYWDSSVHSKEAMSYQIMKNNTMAIAYSIGCNFPLYKESLMINKADGADNDAVNGSDSDKSPFDEKKDTIILKSLHNQLKKKTSIKEIHNIVSQIATIDNEEFYPPNEKSKSLLPFDINYFPADYVKSYTKDAFNKADKKIDFRFSKYTGIVASKNRSVLLYYSSRNIYSWNPKNENKDIHVFSSFLRGYNKGECMVMNGCCYGGLFIQNEKQFAEIIYNNYEDTKNYMGMYFDEFYIFPLSNDALNPMRLLLLFDNEEYDRGIESLLQESSYECNGNECQVIKKGSMNATTIFTHTLADKKVFMGFKMDLKKILAAHRQIIKPENKDKYVVLAYPYQKSYYNRIWPDVKVHLIDF